MLPGQLQDQGEVHIVHFVQIEGGLLLLDRLHRLGDRGKLLLAKLLLGV